MKLKYFSIYKRSRVFPDTKAFPTATLSLSIDDTVIKKLLPEDTANELSSKLTQLFK